MTNVMALPGPDARTGIGYFLKEITKKAPVEIDWGLHSYQERTTRFELATLTLAR